jgi:hypothetical protein
MKLKTFKNYHVTKEGEFYSLKTGDKKYTWKNNGRSSQYERVQFIMDGKPKNFYVHRVVAMIYLKGYSHELEVNHINGNTLDNRLENLEMVTSSENTLKYYEMKAHKILRNSRCIFKTGNVKLYSAGEIYA